ncbi:MAG: hypothetical protein QW409_02645 [Candidatus Aenigmatarchaeota archaeon]
MSNINQLVPGKGYWIYVRSATCDIVIYGDRINYNPIEKLSKGWNLVGIGSNEIYVKDLKNVCKNITRIWSYENGRWIKLNDDDKLIPGKGYWIYSRDECDLGRSKFVGSSSCQCYDNLKINPDKTTFSPGETINFESVCGDQGNLITIVLKDPSGSQKASAYSTCPSPTSKASGSYTFKSTDPAGTWKLIMDVSGVTCEHCEKEITLQGTQQQCSVSVSNINIQQTNTPTCGQSATLSVSISGTATNCQSLKAEIYEDQTLLKTISCSISNNNLQCSDTLTLTVSSNNQEADFDIVIKDSNNNEKARSPKRITLQCQSQQQCQVTLNSLSLNPSSTNQCGQLIPLTITVSYSASGNCQNQNIIVYKPDGSVLCNIPIDTSKNSNSCSASYTAPSQSGIHTFKAVYGTQEKTASLNVQCQSQETKIEVSITADKTTSYVRDKIKIRATARFTNLKETGTYELWICREGLSYCLASAAKVCTDSNCLRELEQNGLTKEYEATSDCSGSYKYYAKVYLGTDKELAKSNPIEVNFKLHEGLKIDELKVEPPKADSEQKIIITLNPDTYRILNEYYCEGCKGFNTGDYFVSVPEYYDPNGNKVQLLIPACNENDIRQNNGKCVIDKYFSGSPLKLFNKPGTYKVRAVLMRECVRDATTTEKLTEGWFTVTISSQNCVVNISEVKVEKVDSNIPNCGQTINLKFTVNGKHTSCSSSDIAAIIYEGSSEIGKLQCNVNNDGTFRCEGQLQYKIIVSGTKTFKAKVLDKEKESNQIDLSCQQQQQQCTSGQTKCENNKLYECVNGQWQDKTPSCPQGQQFVCVDQTRGECRQQQQQCQLKSVNIESVRQLTKCDGTKVRYEVTVFTDYENCEQMPKVTLEYGRKDQLRPSKTQQPKSVSNDGKRAIFEVEISGVRHGTQVFFRATAEISGQQKSTVDEERTVNCYVEEDTYKCIVDNNRVKIVASNNQVIWEKENTQTISYYCKKESISARKGITSSDGDFEDFLNALVGARKVFTCSFSNGRIECNIGNLNVRGSTVCILVDNNNAICKTVS